MMRLKRLMTKGHHGSLQQQRFKMSCTCTTETLNMLIFGLVLVLIAGATQVQALNIANGPSTSSSQFRASLTSTTQNPATSTTVSSTTASTTTTTALPFTVSPTPDKVPVLAADPRTGKRIQLANTPFIRLNRMNTGSRTNSRFLRTFPPLEYLEFARREELAKRGLHRPASGPLSMLDHPMTMIHGHGHGGGTSGSDEDFRFDDDSSGHDALLSNQLGNSPIFYIKLPPAPYVLVPGLGYVSPHPYQNSNNLVPGPGGSGPSSPMMMSPLGAFDFGSSLDAPGQSSSSPQNNVISLPLKFMSNARPAIIVGAKPGVDNGIHGDDKDSGKHTTLLSGGKYSFNGRPNGVFIVRSPAVSRTLNRRQRQQNQHQHPRSYASRST